MLGKTKPYWRRW